MTAIHEKYRDIGTPEDFARADDALGRIAETFAAQRERPLDPVIGAFQEVLLDRFQQASPTRDFYRNILAERFIPPGFAVNLFFRGSQAIQMRNESEPGYPEGFESSERWETALDRMLKDEEERKSLTEILLHKDTITTIYERYAGTKIALNLIFQNGMPLRVADLGCGANYGLKGLAVDEPLSGVSGGELQPLIDKRVPIEFGIGVDLADMYDREVIQWRNECRRPGELTHEAMSKTAEFENRISHAEDKIRFMQGDLLDLNLAVPTPVRSDGQTGYHAVVLSTMCYQMSPEDQVSILDRARTLLIDGGIVIIQDFAKSVPKSLKCPMGLEFLDDWGIDSYRTFVLKKNDGEPKELLIFDSGRCKNVRRGKDFDTFTPKEIPVVP
ncbi:class I SAM-dependent methyltransferase [Candidatus Microgenomates bacterium]|nr:class I SAM-dependent methyltransferase [Candidatus Microgenomates bacterium]